MSSVVETAAGVFERRFLQNAFLPVMLFGPAVAAPTVLSQGRLRDLAETWDAQSPTLKALEIVGYLALVWFLAAIVASQWRNLTRLFEGYPLRRIKLLRPLYQAGVSHHRRRQRALNGRPRVRSQMYPLMPGRVMPTRLGNILRAAEQYPRDRFRAPTVLLWSRLYRIFPTEFASNIESAAARLEFLLVVSAWCASFAGISCTVGLTFGTPPNVVAACCGGGMLLAYLAYRSAIPAALQYGNRLRAGFDLYRLDLLERLTFKRPRSLSEEAALWSAVDNLAVPSGTPPGYKTPPDAWQREWMYYEPGPPETVLHVLVRRGR